MKPHGQRGPAGLSPASWGACQATATAFHLLLQPLLAGESIFLELIPTAWVSGGERKVGNALLKMHRGNQGCSGDLRGSSKVN